jgi:hypothetical protein
MKKKIDSATAGKKLSLNKKTVSNLTASGMNSNNYWGMAPTKKGIGCFTHKCQPYLVTGADLDET